MEELENSGIFIPTEVIEIPPPPHQSWDADRQTIDRRCVNPKVEIVVRESQRREAGVGCISGNWLELAEISSSSIFTLWRKLGWLSSIILIAGTISIIGSIFFLSFLSYGNPEYRTWRNLALQNWFARCLTLSSIVMRTASSMQAGVATSMLASLVLERMEVPLIQTASISSMRNANTGPLIFTLLMCEAFWKVCWCWKHVFILAVAVVFTTTTLLLQFTSTALLSDLGFGVVPGESTQYTLATNFEYDNTDGTIPTLTRGTTWNQKPRYYPVFAEYHEDIGGNTTEDGVSDTGLTLRAFMPLQDQQSRSLLKSYSGRATVLDSRVTCMRPNLTAASVHVGQSYGFLALTGALKAAFNASQLVLEHSSEYYSNSTVTWENRVESYFACLGDVGYLSESTPFWRLSICQPGTYNGQLASEFTTIEEVSSYIAPEYPGTTYLVMNITSGSWENWTSVNNLEDATSEGVTGPGNPPTKFINRNEWLDVMVKQINNRTGEPLPDLQLSVTLCYTAFDTAELNIEATGLGNRSEPEPLYNPENNVYSYPDIRRQFGQPPNGGLLYSEPATSRGTMQLHRRNKTDPWLPGDGDYYGPSWVRDNSTAYYRGPGQPSFILDFANMAGPSSTSPIFPYHIGPQKIPSGANFTSFLYLASRPEEIWSSMGSIRADPLHIFLVQDILQHNGSIAFALQSLITSLSSTAYYDQLKQFNSMNNVTQTNFVIATIPTTHRGFVVVVIVYASHLVLLCTFSTIFLAKTAISTIGNAWQTVAQVRGNDIDDLLEESSMKTDSEVRKIIGAKGLERTFVRLRRAKGEGRVEIARAA